MSKTAKQQNAVAETEKDVSLLDQVMAQTRMAPADEGYDVAKQGVAAFIAELLNDGEAAPKVNKSLVDNMIVELDRKISHQVDEVLHEPNFQQLESAWRGLKLLVDRTDFRENIKLDVLHATKEELLEDFEFATEIIARAGFTIMSTTQAMVSLAESR